MSDEKDIKTQDSKNKAQEDGKKETDEIREDLKGSSSEYSKPEDNKTEYNKAEESKTEENKTGADEHIRLPKPTFTTFILSLSSSALVQLGEVPDPETGKIEKDLKLAKHTIDIISMLHEKITKGLDEEESKLFEALLYELRMKYVVNKE